MVISKRSAISNFRRHLTELRGIYFTRILETYFTRVLETLAHAHSKSIFTYCCFNLSTRFAKQITRGTLCLFIYIYKYAYYLPSNVILFEWTGTLVDPPTNNPITKMTAVNNIFGNGGRWFIFSETKSYNQYVGKRVVATR